MVRKRWGALLLLALASALPVGGQPEEAGFAVSFPETCYVGLPCVVQVDTTSIPPNLTAVSIRLSLPWGLETLVPIETSPNVLQAVFTPPLSAQPGVYYVLPQLVLREKETGRIYVQTGSPVILSVYEPDIVVSIGIEPENETLNYGQATTIDISYLVLNLPTRVIPRLEVLANGTVLYSSSLAESTGKITVSIVAPSHGSVLEILAKISAGLLSFENSTALRLIPPPPEVDLHDTTVLLEAANQTLNQVSLLLGRAVAQGIPVFEFGAADLLASAGYLLDEAREALEAGNASATKLTVLAFNVSQQAQMRIVEAYVSKSKSRIDALNKTLARLKLLGGPEEELETARRLLIEAENITEYMERTEPARLPELYAQLDAVLGEATSILQEVEQTQIRMTRRAASLSILLAAALPILYSYAALRAWRRLLRVTD